MIKTAIRLGLLLVIGIIVYNYFLGTPEEKESSRKIFNEVKKLGESTWALLKSEKDKLDEGKYDEALTKMEDIFDKIKGEAKNENNAELMEEVRVLEYDQQKLKDRINSTNLEATNEQEKEAISTEWQRILTKTENLMNEAEKENQ